MEPRLIALKLMVDTMGVTWDTSTFQRRKGLQKTVYIGQEAGLDLGYTYSWHPKGPYSAVLAQDYTGLAQAIESGDSSWSDMTLQDPFRSRLLGAKEVLNPPASWKQSREDWWELLASVHYLVVTKRIPLDDLENTLGELKPDLCHGLDEALEWLRRVQLLPSDDIQSQVSI